MPRKNIENKENVEDENVIVVRIPKRTARNPQDVYDNVYIPNMKAQNKEPKSYNEWITIKDGKEIAGESGESKESKSTRMLTDYFNSTVQNMDKIKNLSSPQYKLTDKQIQVMTEKLQKKIDEIKNIFSVKVKETEKIDFATIQ